LQKKEALDFFREEYDMNFKISLLQKPLISFLDGYTMGGGLGVCIYGRFRVATENTVSTTPENTLHCVKVSIALFCLTPL
jgi:3-hydroxyisobutyryl-CoA hydrolase